MKNKFKILVTDDDSSILYAFNEVLQKEEHIYIQASNAAEALQQVKKEKPDIIFMDIGLPDMDGLQVLQHIKSMDDKIPVIIITGEGTMQTAIKAMQYGAFQYLLKPLSIKTIRDEISRASININALQEKSFHNNSKPQQHQLVGDTRPMHEIFKLIGSVSTTSNHTNVLITGETGTGKELIARAIHNNSPNHNAPFVAINCTAMPENLLESELFGHEKGAFTGAVKQKTGKFELVQDGTIFLDEIGDLSVELQKKLLRVLQEREFERLGDNQVLQVRARFITATNQDLKEKIKTGSFRKDLFYRLNVININVPPLRERKADIAKLANFFLARYNQELGKNIEAISDGAMARLEAYSYPGNVRELENIIERAVMLTRNNIILPFAISDLREENITDEAELPVYSNDFGEAKEYIVSRFEQQFIKKQLRKFHGNISSAAKACNMSRQNFHRLMLKYGIPPEE